MLESLWQDVRFAVRSLGRNRTTGSLAMLTFGLGIAACTAMFSVVNTVLLRPLPYPEPGRIVNVYPTNPEARGVPGFEGFVDRGSFSYPELEDLWREADGVLDGLAMAYTTGATLRPSDAGAERITVGTTTPDLLGRVLRTNPILGRVFVAEDVTRNPSIIVLGEEYWRTRYGSDAGVLGRTVPLGGASLEVVGVVPAGTRISNTVPDAWVLLAPWENRGDHRTSAIARLADGVSPEQAAATLSRVSLANAPPEHAQHRINVQPRQAETVRHVRAPLLMLAGAAFLLLLIASANVAALLVGRMFDREGELAVRSALGASRWRVQRQIITESAVLALGGAALGILASSAALRGLELIAPPGVPRLDEVALDTGVLLFAVVVSLAAGIGAGVLPGLVVQASGRRSGIARARGMSAGKARLQGLVVVVEIAMATVLLVGGGLLARTVSALGSADAGFAIRELVSFDVSLPTIAVSEGGDAAPAADRYAAIARELETLPGVDGVALTSVLPLTANRGNNGLEPEEYTGTEAIIAERRFVSAGFFEVAGIRLVEGRGFGPQDDRADAPGRMVISQSLARYLWPDEPAVGKSITYWGDRETTVVGVAADQRDEALREVTSWAFYVPRVQAGQGGASFMVRTATPERLLPSIRERVRQVEPQAALIALQPMSILIESELAEERYRARLAVLFAVLATLFSVMGIYGVTARAVASRTREFGIRKALGARDQLIVGQVLRRAVVLAALGGALGFVLAFIATRWVEGLLWGVERTDPLTLFAVAATLAAGALLAAWGPGRRVRRLSPVEALRTD